MITPNQVLAANLVDEATWKTVETAVDALLTAGKAHLKRYGFIIIAPENLDKTTKSKVLWTPEVEAAIIDSYSFAWNVVQECDQRDGKWLKFSPKSD